MTIPQSNLEELNLINPLIDKFDPVGSTDEGESSR